MNLDKVIKYSVPLFVLAIVSRSIEEVSFIYYLVPVFCVFFIVLLFRSPKSNVQSHYKEENPESDIRHPRPLRLSANLLRQAVSGIQYLVFIIPGLWFLLTSLWSSYPEISAARALYFILISLGCVSTGILWIRYSSKNIFDFLLPANVIVVLLCMFSIITNIPSDSWTAGHGKGFIGFFGHQNLLASVILFTLPSVLFKLLQPVKSDQLSVISDPSTSLRVTNSTISSYRNQEPNTNYLPLTAYCLLLTANLLLLTLTYSRSALIALIFGVIVFLILNRNWKVLSYSFVAAVILICLVYLTPSLNQFADKVIKKDFPEVYSSRMWMWEPSYKAALEGGLFGLGYGISHPEIRSGEYSDRFENGRIIREKGNSVLALIEETGVVGLILFIMPLVFLFIRRNDTRSLIPDKKKLSGIRHPESGILLLIASLAAFILHAQFEAWWVGVGSVQLPLFFIYFGLIVQCLIVQGSTFSGSKF